VKVLNLYAGIGGNRKLWEDVEVTAVELNPAIAKIYQDFFPNDKVIVADAHQYLLGHFKEFEFIWSSPPCPSHSKFRFMTTKMTNSKYSRPIIYPDMKLYQEIILLKHYFQGKWVVENVKGYYQPLIQPQEGGRHYFWANFRIKEIQTENNNFIKAHVKDLTNMHNFDISKYKFGKREDQLLRNCVNPGLGLHILNESKRNIYPELFNKELK
jgi:DNA (cytosine-5)-methyltransferase 1